MTPRHRRFALPAHCKFLNVAMQTTNKTVISVRVLFFGAARDAAACEEAELKLNPPHDSASAFAQLLNAYPDLRRFGKSLLFAVNQEYAEADREIFDGDELAVFPPVSGGAENKLPTETRGRGGDVTVAERRGPARGAGGSFAPGTRAGLFWRTPL